MIEGLKLTMTGAQLKTHLEERSRWHQGELRRMAKQLKHTPREAEGALASQSMLEIEIGRTERQIALLTFIGDYIVAGETYRLGEFDLRFADLLPDDDPWDCGCFPPGFASGSSVPKKTSEPH